MKKVVENHILLHQRKTTLRHQTIVLYMAYCLIMPKVPTIVQGFPVAYRDAAATLKGTQKSKAY